MLWRTVLHSSVRPGKKPRDRHAYEVIVQGAPCKLYFDLGMFVFACDKQHQYQQAKIITTPVANKSAQLK